MEITTLRREHEWFAVPRFGYDQQVGKGINVVDVDEIIVPDKPEDIGGKKEPLSSPKWDAKDVYSLDLFSGR
jgi:hypothetical protein